ncbi:hypothetical protein SAMN04488029_0945 [Reichenbachiella faecimaris]|uniref:TfoX N-terminal domain-containing protein n=1 Tax=Reichenbachiella faecimaris TaxID=692418 RepID=A0A1W2G8I1_REIFA|nr:hypothetical protein [Reichenbachiella faecimaris]SMD32596.1 hypothetical protein SAMN04488029_0945 [Reichenbachiella faecimaris]
MIDPDRIARYERLVASNSNFELKGKNMLFTSVNGYMFSQLNKAGELGIRLSKEDGEEFIKTYQSSLFKSYGAVMRGYVVLPDSMLDNTALAAKFLQKSYEFVLSLPPK